jgi:phospholipase C
MSSDTSTKNGLETFDHVVVLMLENRSFDNLLGYLYDKDQVPDGKHFAGLQNYNDAMPIPEYAKGYKDHPSIKPYAATDYCQPFPDPGEVYQHVNTQIFNKISEGNCDEPAYKMVEPFNVVTDEQCCPPMTGFVKDYINTLNAMKDKKYNTPAYELYSVIMQCFEPAKIPVLTSLAKNFAVFDHWFCSVPSQTWCNRAFWHAATSGGKVVNPLNSGSKLSDIEAMISWAKNVWPKKTLFQRMEENNITHAVYTEDPVSLTSLVNGPFKNENVIRTSDKLSVFKHDINNKKLPQYSFIEPKFFGQHNDQHPSSVSGIIDGPTRDGTVLLGEKLISDVYNSIFTNDTYRDNTLLIITYDEHGGCFDHIPPSCIECEEPAGQKGFKFNRHGIRVPMVMVSAYIEEKTIINDSFEHTSFIKTMCKKWGMKGLTSRDINAPCFSSVFSSHKRTKFPTINPPEIKGSDLDYENDPLNELQKSILVGAHYLFTKDKENNDDLDTTIDNIENVGDAIKHLKAIFK